MGGRTYVVDGVMAIKPKFLVFISYHIFLTMVFRALALLVRGATNSAVNVSVTSKRLYTLQ